MTLLREWLCRIGFQNLADVFEEFGYDDLKWLIEDTTEATGLTRDRLKAMGINRDAQLNQILRGLKELRKEKSAPKPQKKSKVGPTSPVFIKAGKRPKQVAAKASERMSVKTGTSNAAEPKAGALPGRKSGPLSDLSEEMQQRVSRDFYTEIESSEIPLGTRIMVADNKGQWAAAKIVGHSENHLTVQWTQQAWSHLTHQVKYDHDFSLSKCSTPTAAFESAKTIRHTVLTQAHTDRREAAQLLAVERAQDLQKLESERQDLAKLVVTREGDLRAAASISGVVAVTVIHPKVAVDDEENDKIVDAMTAELFFNEEEARAIKIGAKIVVADPKGQWADAIVKKHSPDHLMINWTGPWAKMKHQVRYDSEFLISKSNCPVMANDAARRLRSQIRGIAHKATFQVIQCAVGCRVSCKSIRAVATGVYQKNGKVLCDCHKRETAISDFAIDCAQNNAKRPYECLDVETSHGVFSLHELRDVATGNTEVAVQRQHMRNKRLLERVRSSDQTDTDLARKASFVTSKDLNSARAALTGVAPVPVKHSAQKRPNSAEKKHKAETPKRRKHSSPEAVAKKKPKSEPVARKESRSSSRKKRPVQQQDTSPTIQTRSEWVQCENIECNKWRRVTPTELKHLGSKPFLCECNSDINYNCCSRKQEISDKEIDRLLQAESSEDDMVLARKKVYPAHNKPKPVISAQTEFMSSRMIQLKKSCPNLTHQQRFKLAAEKWQLAPGNPDRITLTSVGLELHDGLVGIKVLVPFKGSSKRTGQVSSWLPDQQKFDVCFGQGEEAQWHLMSYAEVVSHKVTEV